jgi:hypothetical protein
VLVLWESNVLGWSFTSEYVLSRVSWRRAGRRRNKVLFTTKDSHGDKSSKKMKSTCRWNVVILFFLLQGGGEPSFYCCSCVLVLTSSPSSSSIVIIILAFSSRFSFTSDVSFHGTQLLYVCASWQVDACPSLLLDKTLALVFILLLKNKAIAHK